MDESGKAAHSGSALIGNADMHLKNGSLIYPDRRRVGARPGHCLPQCWLLPPRPTKDLDPFTTTIYGEPSGIQGSEADALT